MKTLDTQPDPARPISPDSTSALIQQLDAGAIRWQKLEKAARRSIAERILAGFAATHDTLPQTIFNRNAPSWMPSAYSIVRTTFDDTTWGELVKRFGMQPGRESHADERRRKAQPRVESLGLCECGQPATQSVPITILNPQGLPKMTALHLCDACKAEFDEIEGGRGCFPGNTQREAAHVH